MVFILKKHNLNGVWCHLVVTVVVVWWGAGNGQWWGISISTINKCLDREVIQFST